MSMKGPVLTLNNGVEMPAFGLGVYRSGPEETVEAVKTVLANGYRLIDAGVRGGPDPEEVSPQLFDFKIED